MANSQFTTSISTSTTATYTPFTITSFPTIPLTTTFTPQNSVCSDIHVDNINILHIDDLTAECLPTGFNSAPTAFFSPGIACPSGYWTACVNSQGVSSITTITCCPTRGTSIHMTCVSDPASLAGPWVNQFCTWTAGEERVSLEVVQIKDGSTSRMIKTLTGRDGINAMGVRMVLQATDLVTGIPTSTSTPGSSPTSAGQGAASGLSQGAPGPGLSTGATVAIAVIVPVVAIAALVGFFLLWRKRRREALAETEVGVQENKVENKIYYAGEPQELSVSGQAIEMPETRLVAELSGDARPGA